MNRRSSIKYLAGGGAIAALGGGYTWLTKERDHSGLAVDLTLKRLSVLELEGTAALGDWGIARTFDHLAQSIEFSMDGFPVLKSNLFRNTAGRLAFSVFQAQGRMTHGLDEKIPGEVVETNDSDATEAHRRLITALERFESYDGQLMTHFAYGELNKSQYATAHVMHINNHLEKFRST